MPEQTDATQDVAGVYTALVQQAVGRKLPISTLVAGSDQLRLLGQRALSLELYKVWIAYNPDSQWLYVAYFNYGIALRDAEDIPGALNAFRECLRINPDFNGSYINLGRALEDAGQLDAAVLQWMELVTRLATVNAEQQHYKVMALQQIGRTLKLARQDTPAEDALKQCLELKPRQAEVIHQYIALRQAQCKWPVVESTPYLTKNDLLTEIHPLAAINLADDPVFHLACAYRYHRTLIGIPRVLPSYAAIAAPRRKHPGTLRIGYVSSDMREHAVGLAMTDVIETHDRANFEVFVYYCGISQVDPTQTRIRQGADHWFDINPFTDEQVALRIKADGIDILIDLNGCTHSARTGVFMLRPAPVIVNWFGFPCSMGTPYHHYIIADATVIPERYEKFYSEKVLRLPCYQPNDRRRVVSERRFSRQDERLPEEAFVFCCLNGLQKLTHLTFVRWMTILQNVPGSVLWLLSGTNETNERLRQKALDLGVAPERLVFAQRAVNTDHLARYVLADLFLDNIPYGAHTTAADAMWMGIPILTLTGRSFASRVCASLVQAAGIGEMVCKTPDDYVRRAIDFGLKPRSLAPIKKKLAAARDTCLLFDTPRLVQHLEALYREMWADCEAGTLPVPDLRNLEIYHEIGRELDHETIELVPDEAYEALYTARLATWNQTYPIAPDGCLWRAGA